MASSEQTLGAFLDDVAARTPAPASGAAVAVAGGLAAALVELTAGFSDDERSLERGGALRLRLLALADEDAEAYRAFAGSRSEADRDRTIDVPLAIAEAAAELAVIADRLAAEGNPNLVGDARSAALLARAAARAAAELVTLNLGSRSDRRGERAQAIEAAAREGATR